MAVSSAHLGLMAASAASWQSRIGSWQPGSSPSTNYSFPGLVDSLLHLSVRCIRYQYLAPGFHLEFWPATHNIQVPHGRKQDWLMATRLHPTFHWEALHLLFVIPSWYLNLMDSPCFPCFWCSFFPPCFWHYNIQVPHGRPRLAHGILWLLPFSLAWGGTWEYCVFWMIIPLIINTLEVGGQIDSYSNSKLLITLKAGPCQNQPPPGQPINSVDNLSDIPPPPRSRKLIATALIQGLKGK